jgi:hypothetical protein
MEQKDRLVLCDLQSPAQCNSRVALSNSKLSVCNPEKYPVQAPHEETEPKTEPAFCPYRLEIAVLIKRPGGDPPEKTNEKG